MVWRMWNGWAVHGWALIFARLSSTTALFVSRVVNRVMQAPEALLNRIGGTTAAASGLKRLVIVMGQLGDFDSMEYALSLIHI